TGRAKFSYRRLLHRHHVLPRSRPPLHPRPRLLGSIANRFERRVGVYSGPVGAANPSCSFHSQNETLLLLPPLSLSTNNSGAEPTWANRVEGAWGHCQGRSGHHLLARAPFRPPLYFLCSSGFIPLLS